MEFIMGLTTGLAGMFIIATFVIRSREREIKFYKQEIEKLNKWIRKGESKY